MLARVIHRKTLLLSGLLICAASAASFGLVTLIQNAHAFTAICLLLRVVNGIGSAAVDTSSFSMITGCSACFLSTRMQQHKIASLCKSPSYMASLV